ncbi:hypothetical protein [Yoonia sp. 208BN28-4]|uniref:hypothetical protein n=1 Tax=Yoonia sp. 208BN28-4 TaxID=3126505 RepID=UPI0030A56170
MKHFFAAMAVSLSISAPAHAAVDGCLVGTWWADISDIADLMTMQMGSRATALGGDARMDIAASGDMRITVRSLQFNVTMPDAPASVVTINGYSAGDIDAAGGVWTARVPDYNLTGSADVLGQTLSIPFTSSTGMFGGGLGGYWCNGSQLVFETDPSRPAGIARTWRRG